MGNEKHSVVEEVGFDFHWDNEKVWALQEPTIELPITDLLWHFDIPFWEKNESDMYNLTPWEVIREPEKYTTHHQRSLNADIRHPIDVMENKGHLLILDGLHRLVKHYLNGSSYVRVRKIPRSRIPQITSHDSSVGLRTFE